MFIWVVLLACELSEEFRLSPLPFLGGSIKWETSTLIPVRVNLQVEEFTAFPFYGMQSALIIVMKPRSRKVPKEHEISSLRGAH